MGKHDPCFGAELHPVKDDVDQGLPEGSLFFSSVQPLEVYFLVHIAIFQRGEKIQHGGFFFSPACNKGVKAGNVFYPGHLLR